MTIFYLVFIAVIIIIILYVLYLRPLYSGTSVIKGNTRYKADKLMIIAHPDDELIFGSKELIENPGWKVICITNGSKKSVNKISICYLMGHRSTYRRDEFINMMNLLHCQYEIWDYEDNYFNSNWNLKQLKNQLENLLREKNYKMVLTHNLAGEYGHTQHKTISKLLYDINPPNLYTFYYDSNTINPYLVLIKKLSHVYQSQDKIIKKNYKYIEHQSKIAVKNNSK
ncbi:putative N-acetylglucosaminyl phosphatidylinositol deacetylase [Acanthamoeba polyphaga mimivirus]|nr:putative N-acetylglucosaminyl phosphatidylinositol deacetylase [Mimivirus reunion]WMV61731.1 putative N-acetylglucosaminyl phosphatidylinositol deacetylase [Mimivirus sp.]WMV62708.1 putative N-acetylglucosaminyl phosphatidylinositol deacetylase [Acanthamoeba polyphaga mimivirus]WMV63685.1 putative N-acetylglucosaminyl phosphatidylinositol deacetylase [Mimivirus sp.]